MNSCLLISLRGRGTSAFGLFVFHRVQRTVDAHDFSVKIFVYFGANDFAVAIVHPHVGLSVGIAIDFFFAEFVLEIVFPNVGVAVGLNFLFELTGGRVVF